MPREMIRIRTVKFQVLCGLMNRNNRYGRNTARIEDMTKTIKGETVLSGVSMELFGGKIYGIVGKNGSGKTMLFRAISGLIRPDRGKIFWNGQYIKDSLQGVLRLGLVLENIGLHPDLSAQENLAYLAKINCYITKKEAIQTLCVLRERWSVNRRSGG